MSGLRRKHGDHAGMIETVRGVAIACIRRAATNEQELERVGI